MSDEGETRWEDMQTPSRVFTIVAFDDLSNWLDLLTLVPTYIGINVILLDEYDRIPTYIGIIGGIYDC